MIHKTVIPYKQFGERGIGLNKKITCSLSFQLFCGALLSLLAAAATFLAFFSLGTQILDHTVYGHSFANKMAEQQFTKLQAYVEDEKITVKNLYRINAWCSRGDKIYLTLYYNDRILFESSETSYNENQLDSDQFSPELENTDCEYTLRLSDGLCLRAFLYYYTGDAFYFWAAALAGILAFFAFSLCFISLVHRKISYIKHLKHELDILAGGDISYQVSIRGKDELSELASGIDQMRCSILAHQISEEQIRSANSQLVTAMSHDLRTPLTSLLAYLELLERGKYSDDKQLKDFLNRCLDKALQIKSMADKLFEYFFVYTSEWEQPNMELVDADETLQQFWGEYAFSLENRGFNVQQDFGALNGKLLINLDMIRRAFDNLYSNLLKYADPKSLIAITCHREERQVILVISNRISSQRDNCECTNIGLNTCQRILQIHSGTFSKQESGHIFQTEITLPLQE